MPDNLLARADRHSLPTDCRNPRQVPHRQPAGTSLGDRCLPERGLSRDSLCLDLIGA